MKRFTLFTFCICFLAVVFTSSTAADGDDDDKDKKKSRSRVVVVPDYNFEFPEDFEIDLRGYEEMLQGLEPQLNDLEVQLENLEELKIHKFEHLQELEDIVIEIPEIPEINIEIPPIPPIPHPIPQIAVHIPEIDLRGVNFSYDFRSGAHKLYKDLGDEEQVRLRVMRSVARQDIDKAMPALEKIAREDTSPALRYEAVRLLGRFLEDERVVPILGDIIKDDSNLTVRKKAIYLLGKSKDPRAVEILEGIVGLK